VSSELNSGASVALDAFLRSQTEADEVYNYLLVDPDTNETSVVLDLPSEGYLDL
jgi:hypothetical protein